MGNGDAPDGNAAGREHSRSNAREDLANRQIDLPQRELRPLPRIETGADRMR
ncbi:MAG: hypothetical protein ACOC0P_07945 [Planctomycetota bacterium]